MHKVIISGGPSTGKSTTFEALKPLYLDAYFVPEPGEIVIDRELQKQEADSIYVPILPTENYPGFVGLVIDESLKQEGLIPPGTKLSFLDRSLIDNIGYGEHYNYKNHFSETEKHIKAARYTLAFFCDWLGKFERNEIRRETANEGLDIHRRLEDAYNNSGLEIIHLPPVSVEDRLEIIRQRINSLFAEG